MSDPIVEEVHRIREQLLAEAGGDLNRYFQQVRERARASEHKTNESSCGVVNDEASERTVSSQ